MEDFERDPDPCIIHASDGRDTLMPIRDQVRCGVLTVFLASIVAFVASYATTQFPAKLHTKIAVHDANSHASTPQCPK